MKVILLVLGILLALLFLIMVLGKITMRNLMGKEPSPGRDILDVLLPIGWNGFMFGDSPEFVLSRISHLHLLSDEEIEEYQSMLEFIPNPSIIIAKDKYDDVRDVALFFSRERTLCSEQITFNTTHETSERLYYQYHNRMVRRFGSPTDSSNPGAFFSRWGNIVLTILYKGAPDEVLVMTIES